MQDTKVELVRRLVRENDWTLEDNKRIANLVMEETGKFISVSTVVDAIGTQKARRDEFGDKAFGALAELFEACSQDLKLVKFMYASYVKRFKELKKSPPVKYE